MLDDLTDVPLRGSLTRTMVMLDSTTVYGLGADGFIDEHDVIHLHPRSLRSTVVHEHAHYWASQEHFADPWLVEAYAEYLTSLAMPRLGDAFEEAPAGVACTDLPLLDWSPNLPGPEVCAYSLGLAVLRDLAHAAGADTLRQVVGQLSTRPRGVESFGLLVALEASSGRDLTGLMRGRVFRAAQDGLLTQRAALRASLAEALALSTGLGLPPPARIATLIDTWALPEAEAALQALLPLLQVADALAQQCCALQLSCAQPWHELGDDPAHWATLKESLNAARPLLDTYAQLRNSSLALNVPVPAELQASAAALSAEALPSLQAAAAALADIEALEQQCAARTLSCQRFWAAAWDAGQLDQVSQVTGDLTALLTTAAPLEERCGASADGCHILWRGVLEQSGVDAARQTLVSLASLLDQADAAEQACVRAGWPCPATWRQSLGGGDLTAAQSLLAAQQQALLDLVAAEARMQALHDPAIGLERVLPQAWQPAAAIAAARQAFARGELALAVELAAQAPERRLTVFRGVRWGLAGLSVLALVAAAGFWAVRRRRASSSRPAPAVASSTPSMTDAALLQQLLSEPGESSPDRRP